MNRRDIFARPRSIAIATILEFPQQRPKFFLLLSLSLSLSFLFFPLAIIYKERMMQENSQLTLLVSIETCNYFATYFLNTSSLKCID